MKISKEHFDYFVTGFVAFIFGIYTNTVDKSISFLEVLLCIICIVFIITPILSELICRIFGLYKKE